MKIMVSSSNSRFHPRDLLVSKLTASDITYDAGRKTLRIKLGRMAIGFDNKIGADRHVEEMKETEVNLTNMIASSKASLKIHKANRKRVEAAIEKHLG